VPRLGQKPFPTASALERRRFPVLGLLFRSLRGPRAATLRIRYSRTRDHLHGCATRAHQKALRTSSSNSISKEPTSIGIHLNSKDRIGGAAATSGRATLRVCTMMTMYVRASVTGRLSCAEGLHPSHPTSLSDCRSPLVYLYKVNERRFF